MLTTSVSNYTTSEKTKPKIRFFKKGTVILDPGKNLDSVWFIRKGIVRQYIVTETGEEITIHFFRPGAIFPLMLVLANLPNRFSFQATTNLEVQEFSSQKILQVLVNNPKLLFEIASKFALGLNGLSQRIEILSTKNTKRKIYLLLDYFVKQFGQTNNSEVKIDLPLTHAEIATWIGVRRETVSRELSHLTKLGILESKKGTLFFRDVELFSEIKKRLNL